MLRHCGVRSANGCCDILRGGVASGHSSSGQPWGPFVSDESREFVQSLARGLAVIQAFGPDRPAMTISEVAQETGLTRAATRRFLYTLAQLGHVESDGKFFRLRPPVLSLGYSYLSSLGWWQVAQEISPFALSPGSENSAAPSCAAAEFMLNRFVGSLARGARLAIVSERITAFSAAVHSASGAGLAMFPMSRRIHRRSGRSCQ